MTVTILDWKITIGVSVLSCAFNVAYFYWITGHISTACKYAASSLISLGLAHTTKASVDYMRQRQTARPSKKWYPF